MSLLIFIVFFLILLIFFYNKKAVPIFLYHHVNNMSNVSPELFEEHLKIIKKLNMKTYKLSEYYDKKIEKNSILLTFDDGYYDNYKYVFPLLKKYNMKATIFLNSLYISDVRKNEPFLKKDYDANYEAIENFLKNNNGETAQYMSWEEIREMFESDLIDFQAHSHKHVAMFTSKKIRGFTKKENMDFTDLYLYGKIEDNYPLFDKRGEYTGQAIIVKKDFFELFKKYYNSNLIKISNEKEKLKLAQKFIDENEQYFYHETEEEYENRVKEEFKTNKKLIEKNIGNKVQFFCWPWGHRSKKTIKILKEIGVLGFISTKKGTNNLNPNWDMIRRIELRNYRSKKFKINILVARNYILGKIYEWLS